MMANPRKFSEKIALHNQKQAEETAAFEQIMKEVIGATRGAAYPKHQLHINQSLGSFRGGSLPNVNQIGNNSIDLQSALTSLEDMKHGRDGMSDRVHRERGRHATPHQSRRFAFENKRIDVSPYNSAYLSPPPDTNWRRTNSDSALHQSALSPDGNYHGANTPPSQVIDGDGTVIQENNHENSYWDPKKHLAPLQQSRPKSCEVPGINIYPTQEESGATHVPISSNTGSLPDLTSLHFPPPLTTPLDAEDQAGAVSISSYSQPPTSPINNSTLSPTSLSQHHTHGLGPSVSGGTLITNASVGGGGSRHSSPGPSPSPSSRRRHHHNLTNLVIGTGSPRHHSHQHLSQQQQQQQQVRFRPIRHEQHGWINMEGLTMDTNALSLETYPPQPQPQFGVYPQQQQPQQTQQQQSSPQQQQQQQQQHPKTSQSFVFDRTAASPPVPQISMGPYRSTSPADRSCSAPTSPVSQSLSPSSSPGLGPNTTPNKSTFNDSNYYVQQQSQASALQHQLEQFKMMPDTSNVCTSTTSVDSASNVAMFLATLDRGGGIGPPVDGDLGVAVSGGLNFVSQPQTVVNTSQEIDNTIYYSLGTDPQLQSPTLFTKSTVISTSHHTTPQTPQTPTSIPDIILTGADEPIMRQDFAKELGCAISSMCDSFDAEFFAQDEALPVGLGPIDFDGLQILTDPDIPVISDPSADKAFQQERS